MPSAPSREQLERVARPRVLREHEDADPRVRAARISRAARRPSSVCVGGIRMSTIATSGSCSATAASSSSPSAAWRDDLEADLHEQPGQPLPQHQRVVGDDQPHGIRALTIVPSPGRAVAQAKHAAERLHPVAQAAQAAAARGVAGADAVVGHLDHRQRRPPAPHDDAGRGRARVLGDVGQRLRDEEVARGLDRLGQPLGERDGQLERDAGAVGELVERRRQPALGQQARVDALAELAQLGQRVREGRPAPRDDRLRRGSGRRSSRALGEAERHRDRHEALLGAVVEVALDPPPLGVGRLDDPSRGRPRSSSSRARSSACRRSFSSASAGRGARPTPAAPGPRPARRRGQARRSGGPRARRRVTDAGLGQASTGAARRVRVACRRRAASRPPRAPGRGARGRGRRGAARGRVLQLARARPATAPRASR